MSKQNNENEIYQVLTIKNPNYKSLMDICSVKVYNEKHFIRNKNNRCERS